MYKHPDKQKAALSIKKAKGTIQKVLDLIEQDAYCPQIIQQIDAVNGLLKSAKKTLLVGHLDHCIEEKLSQNKKKAIAELIIIFDLK